MYFICLFIPAIISTEIDYIINKKSEKNIFNYLRKYAIYLFSVNFVMNYILYIFAENKLILYSSNMFTYSYCKNYMATVLLLALVFPFIKNAIGKKLSIEIKLKSKEARKSLEKL